jgi:hypothetical protein
MRKSVVVIASGETERRALPHLVAHLQAKGVSVVDVRIPPGGKALNVEMAEKLLKAVWFERVAAPPDKFVVLRSITRQPHKEVGRSLVLRSISHPFPVTRDPTLRRTGVRSPTSAPGRGAGSSSPSRQQDRTEHEAPGYCIERGRRGARGG